MTNIDELIKREKREYHKQWRANNKDKVKQHNKTYWQKKALEKLATKDVTM